MKKYKLTFGIRGGLLSGEYLLSKSIAENMAKDITNILRATEKRDFNGEREPISSKEFWKMDKNCTGRSWSSSYHFVAVEVVY